MYHKIKELRFKETPKVNYLPISKGAYESIIDSPFLAVLR